MNTVNAINILDGNQYLVQNDAQVSATATDFDSVYNVETGEVSLDAIFHKVSEEYGVNESLLKAVAKAESGFDPNATSSCGAMGIMQLMPTTAASLGVEDPYDAEQSITGGAKMLAYLMDDYNGNATLALAAYNAGSGSVGKYGGVPPYKETQNYIKKINGFLGGALENDSTTIAGSQATDLAGAVNNDAPNVVAKSQSVCTSKTQNQSTDGLTQALDQTTSRSNDSLFSYDDYLSFVSTYKQVLQRLLENAENEEVSDYKAVTADQSGEILKNSSMDSIQNRQDTLKYNSDLVQTAVMQNPLNTTSIDSILKTSPQSLYEAQASVVSPVISQLFNLD